MIYKNVFLSCNAKQLSSHTQKKLFTKAQEKAMMFDVFANR